MRIIASLAILLAATPAYADGFAEVVGGVMIPTADSDWTDYVESGPKLGARVGSVGERAGAMLTADWTPLNTDAQSFDGPFASSDISAHRFRFLVQAVAHTPLAANLIASARFGAGLDLSYLSVTTTVIGATSETSDVDPGFALEAGVGLWFSLGSLQLGGEVGLPLSFHSDDSDDDIDLNDYTSFDIDVLFGVRLLSR